MSESWREPGPWDDSLRHRRSWSSRGRHNLMGPPEFDRELWLQLEGLVAAAESHDRARLTPAIDAGLDLPRPRLAALKRTLAVALWCMVTTRVAGEVTDEALEQLAWRVYPGAGVLLSVTTDVLVSVLGDGVRMMYDEQVSYSVKDGEFVLVASVLLAELMAELMAEAGDEVVDMEAIYDECLLVFSAADRATARHAWLSRDPTDS